MYIWPENEASRGPQEIGSCILYHVNNKLRVPEDMEELTLYSDSCGGQNRNIKIALLLMYAQQMHDKLKIINQKFYIPGHSFNSCDRDFGIIEREKQHHNDIYTPKDWLNVISSAKKANPQFEVTKMEKMNFFSLQLLEGSITNRKTTADVHKQNVKWLKMRHIQYRKNKPQKIFFKYGLSDLEDFQVIDIAKRVGKGRPNRAFPESLECLYPNGRPISFEKKRDLLALLKYIPPVHQIFYRRLKTDKEAANEIGLNDEDDPNECENTDDANDVVDNAENDVDNAENDVVDNAE